MNQTRQRVAIARACGWELITFSGYRYQGIRPQSTKHYSNWTRPAPAIDEDDTREWHWLPDYLHDLNAIAEAEATLSDDNHAEFRKILQDVTAGRKKSLDHPKLMSGQQYRNWFCAPAIQRAEAFLKALNLWEQDA